MFIYSLIITGSTYAFYYVSKTDGSVLSGNMVTSDLELSVERVIPVPSKGTSKLISMLDVALNNALKGTGGEYENMVGSYINKIRQYISNQEFKESFKILKSIINAYKDANKLSFDK